ncbi:MAG: prolyl oligopeptidase family serine peptidase [Daejeonella sp.]|uniref:alpha/beta hydrolase family protein n=1 Tax=Daejeonella sp. TaxID=2805397 RepID=UPI0027370938|nr:prolyl oligopeptidase family serine peptidase [Daejeonella sp.]MDP3469404.1 prolyl oligopeptidase family serine peptidase [Daejeonella sp.]
MRKSNQHFLKLLFVIALHFYILTPLVFSAPKPLFKQYRNSSLLSTIYPVQLNWKGFEIIEFKFNGVDAKIVFPNKATKAKNWIWRTQFWGHEPQTDIALLNNGFHLVYVDLVDLYGNKVAENRMNEFYTFLVKNFDLNKKTVLEGMSRGGLDAFNWASENTDKVFCIYVDAPVCDIKSWPGGLGKGQGSKNDWEKCLKAYDLTELSIQDFKGIPLNNCIKLAKAKIPIISVCGDADTVVPFEENSLKLAEIYRAAGGKIELIVKKGIGHHPHSLQDPKPIVDFILKHTKNR